MHCITKTSQKHTSKPVNIFKHKQGFTLVELAIVIVIIGLIVAGVTAGTSLVHSAKIRSEINFINQYKTGFNAFFLQYNAYPGDINNAYSYWGASCASTAAKCNGNADKVVDWSGTGGSTNATDDNESLRYWQHLTLAKLIPGNYTGVSSGAPTGTAGLQPGDGPFSVDGRGKFMSNSIPDVQCFGSGSINSRVNLAFVLGGPNIGDNIWLPGTTVLDAYNIDEKMDDGIGNRGKVMSISALSGSNTNCTQGANQLGGADYNTANFSSSTKYCVMEFFLLR